MYLFPYEGENSKILEVLEQFGEVQEVRHQHWSSVEGVATGTRVVKIVRSKHIPSVCEY